MTADHLLAVEGAVSLAPLPARRAVAQLTGLEYGAARSSRLLLRRAGAIGGLVALVAAATLPVVIHVLSLTV